jgi:FecR protein
MSEERDRPVSEDRIAELLRLAGPRPRVSGAVTARVRAEVHEEWLRALRRRARSRNLVVGLAAIAILAVIFFPQALRETSPPPTPPAIVAAAGLVNGGVTAQGPDGKQIGLASGDAILERTWVETATHGTASLEWNGASIRLADHTRLRLDSARTATLLRGTIYFSSNDRHATGGRVIIGTPLGTIHDVGTQFEVRVDEARLRIRVREGRVDLRRGGHMTAATAATELIATPGAPVETRSISLSGDIWRWAEAIAPPIRLEGLTLGEVLNRIAREKGLRVEWRGPVDANVRLHGEVPFTLDEALDAATASTALTYRIEGGALVLRRRG